MHCCTNRILVDTHAVGDTTTTPGGLGEQLPMIAAVAGVREPRAVIGPTGPTSANSGIKPETSHQAALLLQARSRWEAWFSTVSGLLPSHPIVVWCRRWYQRRESAGRTYPCPPQSRGWGVQEWAGWDTRWAARHRSSLAIFHFPSPSTWVEPRRFSPSAFCSNQPPATARAFSWSGHPDFLSARWFASIHTFELSARQSASVSRPFALPSVRSRATGSTRDLLEAGNLVP